MRTSLLNTTTIGLVLLGHAWAGAWSVSPRGYPDVESLLPRGGQRGTEVTLDIKGQRLDGPLALELTRLGLEVLDIKGVSPRHIQVRLRIAPDAPLGEHVFYLRTKEGISDLLTFHVGSLTEVFEAEPNSIDDRAQPIPLDVTVNGTITSEDADIFRLDLPLGTLTCEVQSLALGDALSDLRLFLRRQDGTPVAEADDDAVGLLDPVLVTTITEPGPHLLEVRETGRGGSARHHYRLHVVSAARPRAALPTGGRPGTEITVGILSEGVTPMTVSLPPSLADPFPLFPPIKETGLPWPVSVPIFPSTETEVVEPADASSTKTCPVPGAATGVISQPGETDTWTFEAKKRARIRVEVLARRLGSPLDPFLEIRNAQGRVLASNDDAGSLDARVDFRVPDDGTYTLAIRDQLQGGGPAHVYRAVLGSPAAGPVAGLFIPRRNTPVTLNLPRGGRAAIVLALENINRNDGLHVTFDGLPKGVTATLSNVHPATSLVPVVLEATSDAPLAGALLDVLVTADKGEPSREVPFRQRIRRVIDGNDRLYLDTPIDRVPLAVREPLPFRIEVETPAVPLVRGSSLDLPVRVLRDEGFKGTVVLRLLHSPPGIRAGTVQVRGDATDATLPLSQSGGTSGDQPWTIVVLGQADAGGIVQACSAAIPLTVVSPYFIVGVGKVRVEPESEVDFPVTLKPRTPFEGKARVEIPNLPRGVSVAIDEIDRESTELSCRLTIGKDAAPGRYRSLVFRFLVPVGEGTAVQEVRGGELRIDPPAAVGASSSPSPEKTKRAWGTVEKPKT